MSESFVTLTSFWSPPEAQIVKLALRAEGIDVQVDGEESVSTLGYANALRAIKLRVRDTDLERARSLLEHHTEADNVPTSTDDELTSEMDEADSAFTSEDCDVTDGGTLTSMISVKTYVIALIILSMSIFGGVFWSIPELFKFLLWTN